MSVTTKKNIIDFLALCSRMLAWYCIILSIVCFSVNNPFLKCILILVLSIAFFRLEKIFKLGSSSLEPKKPEDN